MSDSGAVLREDGLVLAIQRRDNGHWEPPGGVLEPGEPGEAALVREVLEETGLNVEPEALTEIYQNLTRDIVALVFRCRLLSGELRTTPETSDVNWLTPAAVRSRMTEAYADGFSMLSKTGPPPCLSASTTEKR